MKKKSTKFSKTQIKINRNEIEKLYNIIKQIPAVNDFILESNNDSGIGQALKIRFSFYNKDELDGKADITDYGRW